MLLKSEKITAKHGFFTRQGGVSAGIYDSLNCGPGSDDVPEDIKKNREIVRGKMGAERLITAYQTHSDVTMLVDVNSQDIQADGLVTNVPGVALGILTADCVPILLEAKNTQAIGAAHAGWKGARFGIIGSVIRAMQNVGAVEISAAIGPCITKESYEVSQEFFEVFASETPDNNAFFAKAGKKGHLMFDLPSYVTNKLNKHGVEDIDFLDEDTLSQPDKFFSYRRTTHNGETDYGRQISVICL